MLLPALQAETFARLTLERQLSPKMKKQKLE